MTGAVFDWLTSNTKIDYPFDDRQPDGTHRLFVDAYVQHNNAEKEQRLRIATFDPAGALVLKFEDGTTLTSLTAGDNFISTVFGSFTVYAWRKSTTIGAGFTSEDLTARLAVLTAELGMFGFPLSPVQGFLLSSLVNPRIPRIRRLAVAIAGQACCTGGGFTGNDIILEEGNNIQIRRIEGSAAGGLGIVDVDVTRVPEVLEISAIAGAGSGRFIDCDVTIPPLKRINAIGPDTRGDFKLEGRDCVWTERKVDTEAPAIRPNTDYLATVLENLLQLHQNCDACCQCAEYGSAYEKLSEIWARARDVADRVERVRQQYNILAATVNAIKPIRETGLGVRLQVVSRPDFHLAVSALCHNDGAQSLGLTRLRFSLSDDAHFEYIPRSGIFDAETFRNFQLDPLMAGGNLIVDVPSLRGAQYATYSFEVRYKNTLANRKGRVIYAAVQATSGYYNTSDVKSIALTGPTRKN